MSPEPATGMGRELRGRQREDQPSPAGVDRVELEHITKERTCGGRVVAVDDRVDPGDHRQASLPASHCSRMIVLPSAIRPSEIIAIAWAKPTSRTSMSSPSSASPPPGAT